MSFFIKRSLKICQGQLRNGPSGTVAFWVVSSPMLKGEALPQSVKKQTARRTLLTRVSSHSREQTDFRKPFPSAGKLSAPAFTFARGPRDPCSGEDALWRAACTPQDHGSQSLPRLGATGGGTAARPECRPLALEQA